MKHMKRTLAILLTLVLLCTGVPFAFAEDVTIVDSGYCGAEGDGTNLSWTLDSEGTLTISGEGVITEFAFESNNMIKSVIIEEGVTKIGGYAFMNCTSLERVSVSDSVTEIGWAAFYQCPRAMIRIGKGCQTINNIAFSYTNSIEVNKENAYYSSIDGVLFNKDQSELVSYPGANPRTNYTVPSCVIRIRTMAFAETYYLESLIFEEGLCEIEMDGVYCPSLTEVIMPASLRTIGEMAFGGEIAVPCTYTIKSLDAEINTSAFGSGARFCNIPAELQKDVLFSSANMIETSAEVQQYLDNMGEYIEYSDINNGEYFYVGTIRCHAGSTAEAYAIEHGMDYELTHFFEGDWNYDWDNLIRWRKCIHCDERETEPLETETPGGAEIVGPADGDTSFDVEPVSTDYVLIKEVLGEQNVVKAFDISLKNNDGVHVQPKGTVKVKLPGDFKTGDYKVYRVNADGTYTDMNAFLEGSHLVFYTDHFSLYVVVDESAQSEPSTLDTPDTPDTPAKESKVRNILHIIFAFLQKLIRLLTQK